MCKLNVMSKLVMLMIKWNMNALPFSIQSYKLVLEQANEQGSFGNMVNGVDVVNHNGVDCLEMIGRSVDPLQTIEDKVFN